MTNDYERRFSGLARLYGALGAQRIRAAHVVVVGIGGVGSWAAEALARSGIGHLSMIDMDHIAISNVNRQIHALDSTLGKAKVEAMRQRIKEIHPQCSLAAIDDFVDEQNWLDLLACIEREQGVSVNAVIDACDQVRAKHAMAHWAIKSSKVDFITVGAAGGKRLAHAVEIADLAQVTHDPLLAQLRYRLRKHDGAARGGKKIGISCVFSRESVLQPEQCVAEQPQALDGSLNCHGYGSIAPVTATFGMCAVSWVLNQLSSDSGKVLEILENSEKSPKSA